MFRTCAENSQHIHKASNTDTVHSTWNMGNIHALIHLYHFPGDPQGILCSANIIRAGHLGTNRKLRTMIPTGPTARSKPNSNCLWFIKSLICPCEREELQFR